MARERKSVSISVKGDRAYVLAVKEVARKRNQQVAEIVRVAIDSLIGDEVRNEQAIFFASEVARNQQN